MANSTADTSASAGKGTNNLLFNFMMVSPKDVDYKPCSAACPATDERPLLSLAARRSVRRRTYR